MGAMVSARWATGDNNAVVIIMSSSSPHHCHERKERAGQSGHEDGVMITTTTSSPASARGGQTRVKWASGHDDGMMITTERSSLHHCHEHEGRAGQGEVCEQSRRRCDNRNSAIVASSSSPHRYWKCAGEGRERASVRARAVQCTKGGTTVSMKAGRRVNVHVVVQGNRGKDEGKRAQQHRCTCVLNL